MGVRFEAPWKRSELPPPREPQIEEVREEIEQEWKESNRERILGRWYAEQREKAQIEIDEAALKRRPFPL